MKTVNLFLCAMFVFASLSCQQEELLYSCDKQVDSWVKSNLTYVKGMDRIEWESVDEDFKKGCYMAFSPQQRQQLWLGKLNEALLLDWSTEEKAHINVLINFIQTHLFCFDFVRQKTDEEIEEIEVFAYKWMKKAELQLDWNRKVIGGLVAMPHTIINKEGTLKRTFSQSYKSVKTRTEAECNCSKSSNWCSIDISVECLDASCDVTDGGCGFLWLYDCDGRCYGI